MSNSYPTMGITWRNATVAVQAHIPTQLQFNLGDSFAIWNLVKLGGNKVAFQADTGNYLARCNGCWDGGAYPDSAFVHDPANTDSWSSWNYQRNSDGSYSFLSDNGKYLARCNGCVPGGAKPDFAFVHDASPNDPWSRWNIVYVDGF